MPLLLTGQAFRRDLEANGCLAVQAPLEGGAETRLLRRLRGAGYSTRMTSARGLGDPEVFLTQKHGIRPPHLGHQVLVVVLLWEKCRRWLPSSATCLKVMLPWLSGCWKARCSRAPNFFRSAISASANRVYASSWRWVVLAA